MRISWAGEADVAKLGFKLDDDEQKIVTVTLLALLDAAEVERIFGADLRRLVFDARTEARTVSCDQWKPRAVFESHVISFTGHKAVQCLPEFDKVEPAGAGHVRVWIKVPFVLGDRKLTVALAESFGGGIAFDVRPEQGSLLEAVAS